MSEEGVGSTGMDGPHPLAQSGVLYGCVHTCGDVLSPEQIHFCFHPSLSAMPGYHRFFVPKYPMRYSNGEVAHCDQCGMPMWFAAFGTTEWN